jgi:site-specific DNA recombinase
MRTRKSFSECSRSARIHRRRLPRSSQRIGGTRSTWRISESQILVTVIICMMWSVFVTAACAEEHNLAGSTPSVDGDMPALRASASHVPGLPPALPLFYDRRRLWSCCPSKKVRRTREDIRREQQALLEKNKREIDAIVQEFHAKLPREKANSIGAVYARYSSRFQDSIADQIRTLFEAACEEGIFIPREHVFVDLAVRGWKDRRPGLTALRHAIEQKAFQVFLVFTTSRLFRRTYKALQFVEEELVERGIRGIFVKSNLDTADGENWRTMFQLFAAMDEAMVRMYGSHVQAAHEGLFIRGMVCTSLSLGYTGEEVPGEFTKRKLPRRRIVVDPEAAKWIEKIFEWYVVAGKSLDEIPRELNDDPEAPAPAKSLTGLWTHTLVRNHLKNPRYRGYWSYGAKETKWSSGKDYAQQVPRDNPLKSGQFEELRIIADDRWYRAQQLLAEERGNSGRKSKDGNGQTRPRMLRGLFICPEHGRQLVVGGKNAHILICPLCRAIKAEKRPLFTYLKRALALQLTCQKMCELIRSDDELVADIVSACQHEAAAAQKPDPAVLKRLRTQAQKVSSTIEFNRRNPGDTDDEQRQTQELLRDLRRQQTDVLAQLAAHEAATKGAIIVPEPEEIVALLDELGDLLTAAASAETDEQTRTARRIIDELTGGRIDLYQMGERKKCGGWLQGRFAVDVVTVVIDKLTGIRLVGDDSHRVEVVIDYLAPRMIDEQADEAKRLWDLGLLNKQIAKQMDCTRSYVTKLIYHWFDAHGLPRPDGRRRRAHLVNKQETEPVYKQLAEQVVQLVERGLSNLAIARQLKTSDTTVAKAIAWWFRSRGLPVPTAADRRRKLLARAKTMYENGTLIKDIAAELDYTARGLKLALKDYFTELGEVIPDGRVRRGNAVAGESANGHLHRDGVLREVLLILFS